MAKFRKKVKEDFIKKTGVEFSFDTAELESNEPQVKKRFNRNWLFLIVPSAIVVSLVLVVSAVVLSTLLTMKDSVRITRKQYSQAEIAVIEANTFKRLNDVEYPSLSNPTRELMDKNEVEHFSKFANTIYQALDFAENASFAPVNLYPLLSVLAMGSSAPELETNFATLFENRNESDRTALYSKVLKNNYYHNKRGSSFLHNGAFVDYKLGISDPFLQKLTNNYFEAFELDYSNEEDVLKMIAWINDAMQEEDFIKRRELGVNKNTIMYLFSVFLFSNEWTYKYYEKDNVVAPFYLSDGRQVANNYMSHKYYGYYYDYEKYVSVYDYYTNENSVQYIIPKSQDDYIYNLLADNNFLIETGEKQTHQTIALTAPIFTNRNTLSFKNALTKLGLGAMFDASENNFANIFSNPPTSSFIETVQQKNEVSFTVDGTTVKSLTFAGAMSASPLPNDTLEVKLNQPFIYVIRDNNNVPLFIGHYDTPNI
ncbi:MAG TPA: serpin family protein [Bacilli bacterium]|nr:serpin family protein [Bacilli bacterium]